MKRLCYCDLFGAFFYLFFFRQIKFQHTIFVLSLYAIVIDTVIQVEAALEALEGKFFADGFVLFCPGFFLLFETDRQLAIVNGQFKVFLVAAGCAEFQMIGVSRLMNIHRGKAKAFIAASTGGETLKELIYKARKALVSVVVYFYECHNQCVFVFSNFIRRDGWIKRHTIRA